MKAYLKSLRIIIIGGHSTYYKYMNVVKEHGVDFGYIHGVNIENTVRKMYKELKKE